jgi:hypothetical protein
MRKDVARNSNNLAGLRKTTRTCHDSQYSSHDSNPAPPAHKSKSLQLKLSLLSSLTDGKVKKKFSIKVKF